MTKSTRTQRAREAAQGAGTNPYLRRLIEDDDLRASIREAFEAARDAYGRMSNGRGPVNTAIDDKQVHRDIHVAAESLREATERLRGKRKRSGGLGRWIVLGIAGAGLALVLSEDLRKAVLDRLFGAEEEFEYVSSTEPAPEPASTTS